jgi:hypothetical protein
MELARIIDIKDKLADSFTGINAGVSCMAHELENYIQMMDPYVEYFFSGSRGEGSFVGDIVLPSERDLGEAIKSASEIMNDDSALHDEVYDSLKQVHTLQNSVSRIVEMLEMIETYSLNTIVITAKTGQEGQALAAISTEMARMSQAGGSLSLMITEKMDNLTLSLEKFMTMRNYIDGLHENSLTSASITSQSLFKGLLNEFKRLSGEVLGDYGMISSVTEFLKRIQEKFQHEDIVRQNLEKIIYAVEAYGGDAAENNENTVQTSKILRNLALVKLSEMSQSINVLTTEMEKSLKDVDSVVDVFSGAISSRGSGGLSGSDMLDDLFRQLEILKKTFEQYIERIIVSKEEVLAYLHDIEKNLIEFGEFFESIEGIAKKFKTIILLTLIEMSRHTSFQTLLGGALSDVRQMPNQIAVVVSDGEQQYKLLMETFRKALSVYQQKFTEQRNILQTSIALIRKVSVQVYESKKYHDDFISENDKKIAEVMTLLSDVEKQLYEFSAYGLILEKEAMSESALTREEIQTMHSADLTALIELHALQKKNGDYRSMMLVSLASEFKGKHGQEGGIEFF